MAYDFRYANYQTFYVSGVGLLVLGACQPLPKQDNEHTQTHTYIFGPERDSKLRIQCPSDRKYYTSYATRPQCGSCTV